MRVTASEKLRWSGLRQHDRSTSTQSGSRYCEPRESVPLARGIGLRLALLIENTDARANVRQAISDMQVPWRAVRPNGLRLSAAVDPKIFLAVSAARFFSTARFFVCFRNFEKKSLDMLPRIGMIAFDRFGASAWIQTSQSCQSPPSRDAG